MLDKRPRLQQFGSWPIRVSNIQLVKTNDQALTLGIDVLSYSVRLQYKETEGCGGPYLRS